MAEPAQQQQKSEDLTAAEQAIKDSGMAFDDGSESIPNFGYEWGEEGDGDQQAAGQDDAGGDKPGEGDPQAKPEGGEDAAGSGDPDADEPGDDADEFAAALSEQDRAIYDEIPESGREWLKSQIEGANPYAALEQDDQYSSMFEGNTPEQRRQQFSNLLDVQKRFNDDPIGLARDILDTHGLPYDRIVPEGQRAAAQAAPQQTQQDEDPDDPIKAAQTALASDEDMEEGTKAVLGAVLGAVSGLQKNQKEGFSALQSQANQGRTVQTRSAFATFAQEQDEDGTQAHPHYRKPDVQRAMEGLMSRDPAFHSPGVPPTAQDFKRTYLAATSMIPKYREESIEAQVQARLTEEREKNKGKGGERPVRRRAAPRSGQRTRFPGRTSTSGDKLQIPGMPGVTVPKGASTREQLGALLDQQGLN